MLWAVLLQFAFTELITDMRQPTDFPKAISVCTCIMSTLYAGLGAAGYWSKGLNVADIVIFSLGESRLARFAAGCILVQVRWLTAWQFTSNHVYQLSVLRLPTLVTCRAPGS